MSPDVSSETLHQAVLYLQRRTLQLRNGLPFPVNRISAIFFSLLAGNDEVTPAQISALMNLSPVQVSRLVKPLVTAGYLVLRKDPHDGRAHIVACTALGKNLVGEIDRLTNKIAEELLVPLGNRESEGMITFLEEVVRLRGFGETPPRGTQHRLAAALTKITNALGMIGIDYLGSGMEVSRYQVLLELLLAEEPVSFSQLRAAFPQSQAGLSRELDELASAGFVRREQPLTDKRSTVISFTPKGAKWFREIHASSSREFDRPLSKMDPTLRKHFIGAITKISLPFASSCNRRKETREFARCTSTTELEVLRKFLVENLVRAGAHGALPALILAPQNIILRLEIGGQLGAVVELEVSGKRANARFIVAEMHSAITLDEMKTELLSYVHAHSSCQSIDLSTAIISPWKLSPAAKRTPLMVSAKSARASER